MMMHGLANFKFKFLYSELISFSFRLNLGLHGPILALAAEIQITKILVKSLKENNLFDEKCVKRRNIQGVPGGKDLTSGECSLGQTIPI
jgi:hypothetical protein